jgi:hypothetical protein
MRILAALALATAALAVPTAAWAYGSDVSAYVLGPGQSLTFHFVLSVKHRVFDGLTYGGPGTVVDSTCTVTGA